MKNGSVILVGAGPGGRGLLTIRGEQALREAEVVVYDRLVSADILRMMPESAEKINVGKESSRHLVRQPDINRILLEKAKEGKRVVRLKGGDPFVFGRGGEELELLVEHGVPFEVVPGVTSAVAACAFAGIPVTHRDYCSSFHVITGHAREGKELTLDFNALACLGGTLVFLMGVASLPSLAKGLLAAGMDAGTPAAVVENGARQNQRKVLAVLSTLAAEAERAGIRSPAVIVVGKVCALSERFDWFSSRPLFGKKILVTRSRATPGRLAALLEQKGAEVLDVPVIDIAPIEEQPALSGLFSSLNRPGWLLFSSKTAVEIFFSRLLDAGKDLRALSGWKIGAVGAATAAALRQQGVLADLTPDFADGVHLGRALRPLLREGERVVSLESLLSAGGAEAALADLRIELQRLPLYDTVFVDVPDGEELLRALFDREIGLVTFSSASMAESLSRALGCRDFTGVPAVCIGEQTAARARELGFSCFLSEDASIPSMAERVEAFFNK